VPDAPFLSRQERFASVGSTNDVVRAWLDEGTPEVCLAVADEQTAGRGRADRRWQAPPGAALLQSLGFRPTWLAPEHVWRLPATVSLAMADAVEEAAGLPDAIVRLKWPNDLVVDLASVANQAHRDVEAPVRTGPDLRKLAGVLGESGGLGTADPRVVVGIGVNAGWRRADFPPDLAATMTSLDEASGGRPIDLALLLDGFLSRLEVRIALLREGRFDVADWTARQATTRALVELHAPDGGVEVVRALGVDAGTGALVVEDTAGERQVHVGEIRHVRLAPVASAATVEAGV
jgi:BirA family transcriptional regulator, biotin operon repressor / biotin---[acetyl-CoA-carboxylase] ligase